MLPHGESRGGLRDRRRLRPEVPRPQSQRGAHTGAETPRRRHVDELAARGAGEHHGRVGQGLHAAGDTDLGAPGLDVRGHDADGRGAGDAVVDDSQRPGARGQARGEHDLTRQVRCARIDDDVAVDERVDLIGGQPRPFEQRIHRMHRQVPRAVVAESGSRLHEGRAHAHDDGDSAARSGRVHGAGLRLAGVGGTGRSCIGISS